MVMKLEERIRRENTDQRGDGKEVQGAKEKKGKGEMTRRKTGDLYGL